MKHTILLISACFYFNFCSGQYVLTDPVPMLVADANPGAADGGADNLITVDDRLYYEANGTLWMYDGNTAAAVSLDGITYIHQVGQLDGSIYFLGSEAGTGNELYKHDGIVVTMVADMNPSGDTQIDELSQATLNGYLYFVADDGDVGSELWRTNGTGATRVSDIALGNSSALPQNLSTIDSKLYFTAIETDQRELYTYDGSSIENINIPEGYTNVPDKDSFELVSFKNALYFTAYHAASGNEIWKYDGTNLSLFSNEHSDVNSNPSNLTVVGEKLFWTAKGNNYSEAVYLYNGSSVSISEASNVSEIGDFSAFGDELIMRCFLSNTGKYYLATFDGSYFLTFAEAQNGFESYFRVGDYVYFNEILFEGTSYQIGMDKTHSGEEYTWDINSSGVELIRNLNLHHNTLYFESNDGDSGQELWQLRTTNFSPEMVKELADTALIILENTVSIDLSEYIIDQDQDAMSVTISSSNTEILDVSETEGILILTLNALGVSTLSLTVTDEVGGVFNYEFIVDVINPYLIYEGGGFEEVGINDGSLTGEITVRLTGDDFVNAEGTLEQGVHYTVNNLPDGLIPIITVSADGKSAQLTISDQAVDHEASASIADVNLTFMDAAFVLSESLNVTHAVEASSGLGIAFDFYPPVSRFFQIEDIIRTVGSDPVVYNLRYTFQNPGSYALTFTTSSFNETAATASVVKYGQDRYVEYELTVTPESLGTSEIAISVTTEHGAETNLTFNIQVINPSLHYSPSVTLLDDVTLTYEGARIVSRLWSPVFSPDGLKMFRSRQTSAIYQLEFNKANDITAGATSSEELFQGVSPEFNFTVDFLPSSGTNDVAFSSDGYRVYMQSNRTKKLHQLVLNKAFDLRSGYTTEISVDMTSDISNLNLSIDGNSLFSYKYGERSIRQFALNSPFDISGGINEEATFDLDSLNSPYSYQFDAHGKMIFVVDDTDHTLSYYQLAAPFDLSVPPVFAGRYTLDINDLFDPESTTTFLDDVLWSKDKTKLFLITEDIKSTITIKLHQYQVTAAVTDFVETETNTGQVEGELLINTQGVTFVKTGESLIEGSHYTIDNLPAGFTPVLQVSEDGYQAALTLEGKAIGHYDELSVDDLKITFTNDAFSSGSVSSIDNSLSASTGFGIVFTGCGYATFQEEAVCESYEFNGTTLTEPGTYQATLLGDMGCDNLVTLTLTLLESHTIDQEISTCDTYFFNGSELTVSGEYSETFTNKAGCDSLVNLSLTLLKSSSSESMVEACQNYNWNETNYDSSGTYEILLTNSVGCDSLATLHLSILPVYEESVGVATCTSYAFDNQVLTESGAYSASLLSKTGCDSLVNLSLTIWESFNESIELSSCGSYLFDDELLTATGSYQATYNSIAGCDSLVNLNLTILSTDEVSVSESVCDSYVFNNETLVESGEYPATFTNRFGCDSLVTLNLTILENPIAKVTVSGLVLSATEETGASYQWFDCNSNEAIEGATSSQFTSPGAGNYSVEVTNEGCSTISECTEVVILSAGYTIISKIVAYPNPSNGIAYLDLGRVYPQLKIEVFNMAGQLEHSQVKYDISSTQIELGQQAGLYIIKISTPNGQMEHIKVMKN